MEGLEGSVSEATADYTLSQGIYREQDRAIVWRPGAMRSYSMRAKLQNCVGLQEVFDGHADKLGSRECMPSSIIG